MIARRTRPGGKVIVQQWKGGNFRSNLPGDHQKITILVHEPDREQELKGRGR